MKVSEAIQKLEDFKNNHGDLEVTLFTDATYSDYDGSFIPLFGFTTEDIWQGDEDEEVTKAKIAVLDFHKSFIHGHE